MAFPEMLELRKRLNIPQTDMAHYLGIKNPQLISQWENGVRSPTEPLRRLVRHLNNLSFVQAKTLLLQLEKRASK